VVPIVAALLALLAPAAAHAQGPAVQGWSFPTGVVVSPDGRFVYGVGSATPVFARDPDSGRLSLVAADAPGGQQLRLSPSGTAAYLSAWQSLAVLSRDPQTGVLTHQTTYRPSAFDFAAGLEVLSSGRLMVAGNSGGTNAGPSAIELLDLDPAYGLSPAGTVSGSATTGGWLNGVQATALVPGGRSILAGTSAGLGGIGFDPFADWARPHAGWTAGGLAISPDGRRVYSGRGGYEVYERDPDTETLTHLQTVFEHCRQGSLCAGEAIAPTPDGARVFNADTSDRAILQARVTPGGVQAEHLYVVGENGFEGVEEVSAMAWAPDGRDLYAVGGDAASGRRSGALVHYRFDPASERLRFVERFAPETPILGRGDGLIEIDGGAAFTADREVALNIVPPAGGSSVRLSNSGDFGGVLARRLDPDRRYEWTLAESGTQPGVRHVHARFMGRAGAPERELSARIVLDERPPKVLSARLKGNVLRVRARDNRSGLRQIRFKRRPGAPARKLRYRPRIVLRRATARSRIRVLDRAGNRSRWRRVKVASRGD
jgi:hypothetical protein